MQDTRRNTYELLHTKPVSAGKYLSGKVGGGFTVCLIILAILNLIFFGLCLVSAGDSGFTVRLSDFLLATCLYILPNMLMIVSIYSLVSLLFKVRCLQCRFCFSTSCIPIWEAGMRKAFTDIMADR